MSNETIKSIGNWFAMAHGTDPSAIQKKLTVQTAVHFEEVGEMLESLRFSDLASAVLADEAIEAIKALADHLKAKSQEVVIHAESKELLLDSLCDQIVTAVGVAHDNGFDIAKGLVEVNRSNFSKFVNGVPVFDENGKIKKGPDYTPPNLASYVN